MEQRNAVRNTEYCVKERLESLHTCQFRTEKTIIYPFLYFSAIKTCYCTMLSSMKTLPCSKNFVKPFNHSLILTGCSLCCDPFFYNWEALRHPRQLERFDKRKLRALPNPLLNLPFFPPNSLSLKIS